MSYILTTQCADDIGLIAKITGLCNQHNLNIIRNNEFVDKDAQRFLWEQNSQANPAAIFYYNFAKDCKSGTARRRKNQSCIISSKRSLCLGDMLLNQLGNTLAVY